MGESDPWTSAPWLHCPSLGTQRLQKGRNHSASPTAPDSTSPACDDSVITETEATAGPYPVQMWKDSFSPKYPWL